MLKKKIIENVVSEITSNLLHNDYSINLQISILNKKIVITTHKIASRFIEELSVDKNTGKSKTIEVLFYFNRKFNFEDTQSIFGKYNYEVHDRDERKIKYQDFLSILKINSINDIFNYSNIKEYDVVFLIRNPLFKFLSGWAEIIDQTLYSTDCYSEHQLQHIEDLFQISDVNYKDVQNKQLRDLDPTQVNKLLKGFSNINNNIISDNSHTKEWCLFIENLLFYSNFLNSIDNTLDIEKMPSFIRVVDMDEENSMTREFKTEYSSLNRVTHLDIVYSFITNPSNSKYLDTLFGKRINLLNLDYNSYLFLKKLSKKQKLIYIYKTKRL